MLRDIIIYFFTIFVLSILLPVETISQVIIKEKVEINPQRIIAYSPTSINEHIFTYTLTWTPSEYHRGNIQIIDCNSDTLNSGWSTSGITTISFPGNGRHHFLFQEQRWFYHNFWGWGWWGASLPGRLLQVFIDGIDLNHPQNVLGTYNGVAGNFNLNIDGSLCPSDYASLSINNIQWAECNGPNWYETDPVNLQIVEGQEYASFFNIGTGTDLGNTTQLSQYTDISNIGLKRNESAPPVFTTQVVKIEANINGVIVTSETEYYPEIFVIETDVYPDTITTGENSYLDIFLYSFCAGLPFETKINVEIIKGQEYGSLIDPYTNERTKILTNLEHWFGSVYLDYVADGISTEETDTVIIRVSTTDPEIEPKEASLTIKPPPIYVYTIPDVVGADDTADVIIKKRNADGTLEDFPPEQTFELAVIDGCVNGNVMVDDSVGVYFADAQQPIKFVTADSLESDSGFVRLRVGTDVSGFMRPIGNIKGEEEKQLTERQRELVGDSGYSRAELRAGFEKKMEEKKTERLVKKDKNQGEPPLEVPIIGACYNGNYINEIGYWEGDAKYKKGETIKILLGETKYYQAKYNSLEEELKIEEIKPDANGVPQQKTGTEGDWEWITTTDVWDDNPVTLVECDTCGKKIGVYWEKEKPVWNGNENKGDLAIGLIRIVGRYWHQDSTYIVNLKAKTTNGDSAYLEFRVIKPSKLQSDNQTDSYSKTRDVFDAVVNIDSLCIYYSGINGIPPQFVKGHIFQESAKTDFGGTIGWGFAPSYRYEPYTTQNKRAVLEGMKNNPFYITSSTNVNPPNHSHVKILPYFSGDTITVWQIIDEHSQLVRDGSTPETRMYGVRTVKDTMSYGLYKTIQRKYHSYFAATEKTEIIGSDGKKRKLTFAERADSTNKRMIIYLRDEFEFNDINNTKGMKNMIAQTRIASSYGYFQPLYTTAINPNDDWLYPENSENPPENLNTNDVVFPMATRMHRVYLENGLKNQSNNNWMLGFEASLKKYIFERWNTADDYPNEVINNVNRFLPQK